MNRRMIWLEDEHFAGWCCSQSLWTVIPPRLDSTVAVLAFNVLRKRASRSKNARQHARRDAIPERMLPVAKI